MTAEAEEYSQPTAPVAAEPAPVSQPGVPQEASPSGATSTPQEAQAATPSPTSPPPEQNPNGQGVDGAKWMVDAGVVDQKDIQLAANLSRDESVELFRYKNTNVITEAELPEFIKLTPAERQKKLQEKAADRLIKAGVFGEEYRAELQTQPTQELLEYWEEFGGEETFPDVLKEESHPSDSEIPSLKNITDADLGAESPEIRQAIAEKLFDWCAKGGMIDQGIAKLEEVSVREKYDKLLLTEAETFWSERQQHPDDLKRMKLDMLADDAQKGAFIDAYQAQRLLDPEYVADRDAKIAIEVELAVDNIRRKVRTGSSAESSDSTGTEKNGAQVESEKGLWKKLKDASPAWAIMLLDELKKTGQSALEASFDNDLGDFMRALLLSQGGYSRDHGYSGGYDSNGARMIGQEYFENVTKKPEQFGKVLADAYQNDEFIKAGFSVSGELLQSAKNGNPQAVRDVMESFLKDLFDGSATAESLALRWKAARVVLPEAMYPGKKVSFDDKMKEHFEEMKNSIGVNEGLFDKTFPSSEAASGSGDVESQPAKTDVDKQPAPQSAAPQTAPQAA